jgi:membrane protein YdbS with pleckstrin-like domain
MAKKVLGPDKYEFTLQPSQWVTIGWMLPLLGIITYTTIYQITSIFLAVISGLLLVGFIWNRVIIMCWKYEFHERTITERKGVLSVSTQEIHYFRIKSIRIHEPLFYRFVGLRTYYVLTSDPLIPVFRLYAVKDDGDIRELLKKRATYWRNEMGVKETDFHDF